MDPQIPPAISQSATAVAVGGLVMILVQSTKRWTPDGTAPIMVGVWTLVVMAIWCASQPVAPPPRSTWFELFGAAVVVYVSALGLYSAARHTPERPEARRRRKLLEERGARLRLRRAAPPPPHPHREVHDATD